MEQFSLEPIRQALNSGEFARAQTLWNECADGLGEELKAGVLSAARLAEVNEFVAWSRGVILCERAHLLDQLNSLHVAGEYDLPILPAEHRLVEAEF